MQSKFDLAKEAYQAIISANGMPQHIQSVAWRQLGVYQLVWYMLYQKSAIDINIIDIIIF